MDDLIQEFLVESNENLDRVDSELVKLESDPSSAELLASIFRGVHSIKGACGFLGFNKLQTLAHAGENLLSKLRDGTLLLNPEISTALLAMVDGMRQMLAAIAATGQDGDEDFADTVETLKRLQEGAVGTPPVPSVANPPTTTPVALPPPSPGAPPTASLSRRKPPSTWPRCRASCAS